MNKNFIASVAVAGAVTLSSVAASAAPIGFESADRTASPVEASEEALLGDPLTILLFLLISAGVIILVENNGKNSLPASP